MITRATYVRQIEHVGGGISERAIELSAEVFQDGGAGFASELLVIWTDETLAAVAVADLDMSELEGCQEAIEEAFWSSERAECRKSYVRQQTGERAA